MKYWIIIFCLILSLSLISNAHLGNGKDIEVGDYLIDLGYDPAKLTAGEKSLIAINLVNLTNLTQIEPESVFIRISNPSFVEFSGTIQPGKTGSIAISYTFLTGGEYEIDLRFILQNNETIETTIKLDVSEKPRETKSGPLVYSSFGEILSNPSFLIVIISIILIQIIIGYVYFRKYMHPK